jgi:hypothetical protein
VWPQCWDVQGPRGLEQRDLRNLNLGDLKKGPNGGVSPKPHKKKNIRWGEGILRYCQNLKYTVSNGKVTDDC